MRPCMTHATEPCGIPGHSWPGMVYATPVTCDRRMVYDKRMDAEDSDEALMLRYGAGETGAFDIVYHRHKGPLYRYLLRQLHNNRALTDELFQDIWMRIIDARQRYAADARFRTYLFHLARNRLIDHYRASGRTLQQADDCPDDTPAARSWQPEVQVDSQRLLISVRTQIEQLPPEQREAFLLKEEAGLSLEEIATITQVNRETVKSRLRYALDKLRTGLAAAGIKPGESMQHEQ